MTVLAFFFADLSAPGAVLFGIGALATIAVPVQLADAHLADFDPRPALARATAVARQGVVHVGRDFDWVAASVRHELFPYTVPVWHAAYGGRESYRDLVALLILLTTSPKGGMSA